MKIIETAIKKPVFTTMIYVAIVILGFTGLTKLSIDFMPDIEFPAVIILTQHHGVGPQEIENSITRLVEGAVASTEGIDRLMAVSREGVSAVTIMFKWGSNLDAAVADVRDKLDFVVNRLPSGVQRPMIFRLNMSMMPIMLLALVGDKPMPYLYDLADQKIKDHIVQTPGVANVNFEGVRQREVQVVLNRNRLDAYNMTPDQIIGVLQAENINASGGTIESKHSQFILRTQGEFQDVEEIRNIIVAYQHGIPVYLRYLADVDWGISEENAVSIIDGKEGLRITVQKQSGANTIQAVRQIQAKLGSIQELLPHGVELKEIFNTADFTQNSINNTATSGILGALLAVIVVFFFLRNIRASIIIGLAIPFSIITTFIGMYFFKINLNMVSLGGLTLGIGMLIDNAIIVLENTYNYLARGQKPADAARLGAQEIIGAIFAATLTTVCVFLPIVFTGGMAKEIFNDMALTVVFSLTASLFVAVTLVPMLSSKYLRYYDDSALRRLKPRLHRVISFGDRAFIKIEAKYKNGIRWALDHRKTVLLGTAGVFLFTMVIVMQGVDFEFMPESDDGQINASINMPVGTRLGVTTEAAEQMSEIVRDVIPAEQLSTLSYLAGNSGGMSAIFSGTSANVSTVRMRLVPKTQRRTSVQEYIKILSDRVKEAPAPLGVAEVNISGGGGGMGGGSAIEILVRGHDLRQGAELAKEIKDIMDAIPDLYNVDISRKEGAPELVVHVDRQKAASLGVNMASVGMTIQQSVLGRTATFMREEGREYDIFVRLDREDRSTIEDIENIQVLSAFTRRPVRIGNIATITQTVGPVSIERDDQMRVIRITADTFGGLQQAVDKIKQEISQNVIIPEGFSLDYQGSFRDMQETLADLLLALIVAICLIYAVMAAIFESYIDPFIIFFTIPLAIVGAIWVLFLTGTALSVNAMIGILVLSGVVVNTGIVLVNYINILRARGLELKEAIMEGGRRRLRPILMMAMTTILALTPLAIGLGEGAEMNMPLARTVIGGLITSTLLSLFFVPAMYFVLESYIETRRKKKMNRPSLMQRISDSFNDLFSSNKKRRVVRR
jgi:HAE1 family hydrophobic/amphiphilic exporter-1